MSSLGAKNHRRFCKLFVLWNQTDRLKKQSSIFFETVLAYESLYGLDIVDVDDVTKYIG